MCQSWLIPIRAGDNRRRMWGRSWTSNWPEPKTSTHKKIFKPLWWMDSNGLQQMSDCLKMLEDKARKYKEPIKTLKPKFLKKVNTLQENCSCFQWDKLSRVFVNRLNWLTSFCFITWSDRESGDYFLWGGMHILCLIYGIYSIRLVKHVHIFCKSLMLAGLCLIVCH